MPTGLLRPTRLIGAAVVAAALAPWFGGVSAYAASGSGPATTHVGTAATKPKPVVTGNATCSAIDLALSNLDGGAGVDFTLTLPGGHTDVVTVPPTRILRKIYPVSQGAPASVTVTAPGMAAVTKAIPSTCTTRVLGEKVVRHPSSGNQQPAATGPQLPFTGLPTGPAIALAVGLIAAGAALSRVRRPASR